MTNPRATELGLYRNDGSNDRKRNLSASPEIKPTANRRRVDTLSSVSNFPPNPQSSRGGGTGDSVNSPNRGALNWNSFGSTSATPKLAGPSQLPHIPTSPFPIASTGGQSSGGVGTSGSANSARWGSPDWNAYGSTIVPQAGPSSSSRLSTVPQSHVQSQSSGGNGLRNSPGMSSGRQSSFDVPSTGERRASASGLKAPRNLFQPGTASLNETLMRMKDVDPKGKNRQY
jgi:hypothetical protein